jgi:pimeloyl-ACP methyl ester carboxylesterase
MLNYQIEGDGPPLLLIHGFGISFNIWKEISPILRDRFTLVTVELPGIGCSPLPPDVRPYLTAAVEELDLLRASLNLPRWSVLGYSSGSRVAEAYLQTHRDRVDRAIFLCPAHVTQGKATGLRIASLVDEHLPALGNMVLSGWRIRFLIRLLAFNLRRDPAVELWYAEITSQPVEILKKTLRSMPDGGACPFKLPNQIPVLFIWGSKDWITATPRRLSVRDVVIQANHSAPQTSAHTTAESILSFLGKDGRYS